MDKASILVQSKTLLCSEMNALAHLSILYTQSPLLSSTNVIHKTMQRSRDTSFDTSTQSVEDKLKRVILHDLEHGKQGRPGKSDRNDEYALDKYQQDMVV
mgnify:FL=1